MPAFWVEAPDVRSGVVLYCSQSQGIGAVRRWVDVNLKKKSWNSFILTQRTESRSQEVRIFTTRSVN